MRHFRSGSRPARQGPAYLRKPPPEASAGPPPGFPPSPGPAPTHLREPPGASCGPGLAWGAEAVGSASCLQGAATADRSLREQLGARAALPVAGRGGPTSGRPRSAVAIPVSLRPRGPPESATMPLGLKPTCSVCKTTSSSMWKKGPQGEILCHHCTGRGGAGGGGACSGAAGGTGGSSGGGGFGAATFASTSAAPPQSNGGGGGKQVSSSGRFRRRRPTRGEVNGGLAGGEGPGLRDRCALLDRAATLHSLMRG